MKEYKNNQKVVVLVDYLTFKAGDIAYYNNAGDGLSHHHISTNQDYSGAFAAMCDDEIRPYEESAEEFNKRCLKTA